MAVIGKIRKHSGIVVAVIGVALAGFILMQDSKFGSCNSNKRPDFILKVDNQKITPAEFELKADQIIEAYQRQLKTENLTSDQSYKAKQEAFDQLERETILQKQYEKLGLAIDHEKSTKPSISPEELSDMMMGRFIHPYIAQQFTDPKTGQVNKQYVQSIIQNFDKLKEEEKKQWVNLEQAIKDDRLNTKYNMLLAKGMYLPTPLAKKIYADEYKTCSVKSIGLKYQTVPDANIKLTDEDYQKYYDNHKYEYKQDESIDLDFVVFDVLPSSADKVNADMEISKIYNELEKSELKDVENYVNANSDTRYDSTFFKKGSLPLKMDSLMFAEKPGFTEKPYVEENTYYIAKLIQTQMRPDSMKASVILITYKDAPAVGDKSPNTKEQAKARADSVINIVKKTPKLFNDIAVKKSEFPEAKQDSGNLKWFADGDLNYKFYYDSCFNMKINESKIIVSPYGYMVLQLTAKKTPEKKVKVAILKREIQASKQTEDSIALKASEFAGKNRTTDEFIKSVVALGYNKRSAQNVKPMDYTLPGLESGREILRWAFEEKTKKGEVSSMFDLQGKYVVATLLEKRKKGIPTLDQVKKYIEPLIKRDKKAEVLITKLNTAVNSSKDLNALSVSLNSPVDTVNSLMFASPGSNYPKYGPEPALVGTIFGMKPNKLSAPIKGNMAVYLVNVDAFTPAPELPNINMFRYQYMQQFMQRISNDIFNVLLDKTEIVDNRLLFGY